MPVLRRGRSSEGVRDLSRDNGDKMISVDLGLQPVSLHYWRLETRLHDSLGSRRGCPDYTSNYTANLESV